jgi:hypothetical protein
MDPTPPPVQPDASPYLRPTMQGSGPACPQCSSTRTSEVKYTWWGGILGPKMMNLQKCEDCRFHFNRKTNKGVANAIIVYNLVVVAVSLVILFFVWQALS